MSTAFTPLAFLIVVRSVPGICFSVMMKTFGSSVNSKSSTMACLMLMLLDAMIVATSARIPGMLGSTGMISITPHFMWGATSFRWQVGVRFENILRSSGSFVITSLVAVTALLSTWNALAIFESASSIWPAQNVLLWILIPYSIIFCAIFFRWG